MEKQNNYDYGHTDPDFIDQNTLIDGTYASNEDQYKQDYKTQNNLDYGETDPDYIDQNTPLENDNYARDEDPYQYQEEFIEDGRHLTNDFTDNEPVRAENIPNQERIVNEDGLITNDSEKSDLDDDDDISTDLDFENDLEKDGDLDNDEELDDFDAEHYHENHPRE